MKTLKTKALRAYVGTQHKAADAADAAAEKAETRARRRNIGIGAFAGWMTFSTAAAFAQAGDQAGGKATTNITNLIGKVGSVALVLMGAVVLLIAVYGAIQYATALDSTERAKKARKTFVHLAIGIFLAGLIYVGRDLIINLTDAVNDGKGQKVNDSLKKGPSLGGRGGG